MLSNKAVHPTLPAVDLKRARAFYEQKLGLKLMMEDEQGLTFAAGHGSLIYLYKRGPTRADHTVAEFVVDDIEAEIKQMRNAGIKFEEYDIPEMGLKTVNGIARMGEYKGAWFKDSEGNILGVGEEPRVMKQKSQSTTAAVKR